MAKSIRLPEKKPVGSQPICFKRLNQIDPVWCPGPVPSGFWQDENNQRNYLLWLAHKLRYRRMEHWYRLTVNDFIKNHGSGVLNYHHSSLSEMLRHFFPEYDWQEWLFGQAPKNFWPSTNNQRRFLEWLGNKLGVRQWEDWYHVVCADIQRHGGDALMSRYQYRMAKMMSSVFPENDWKPWLFAQVSQNFWTQWENRRAYMLWLGEQLGFQKPEDWYQVMQRDFKRHGGAVMLMWYYRRNGSVATALMDVFPDYPWDFMQFKQVPNGYFKVRTNRLRYLRWLGDRLGFKQPSDWYRMKAKDFQCNPYSGCFVYYHNSPSRAAMDLYPKYPWKEWLFDRVPAGFWTVPENQRRYITWLGKQLGFRRRKDWYNVRNENFCNYRGYGLLKHYHTMSNLLRKLLPDLDWDSAASPISGDRLRRNSCGQITQTTSKCCKGPLQTRQ